MYMSIVFSVKSSLMIYRATGNTKLLSYEGTPYDLTFEDYHGNFSSRNLC